MNKEDVEFKPRFVERYEKLTDFAMFKKYSLTYLRRSIRVNTLKIGVDALVGRLSPDWILEPVPWCKEGFFIEHKGPEKRRDIGNLKEHQLGYFFVQEAASMIPPLVLEPQPGERILDMCASPGSKTTQIAQYMQNRGRLVANDYKGDRIKSLGLNVQRMGITNCVITLSQGRFISGHQYDRILVDAPCSGTGAIRKSFKTLLIWNPVMISRLAGTQKQLIETAWNNLKPGGVLVYSTCSVEPEEDEGVVSWLLSKHPEAVLEPISLPGLKRTPAITEFNGSGYEGVENCLRLWPQDNDTEGFFVARVRKVGSGTA
jgi:tRNA (cytosine49-C5)-methyltransferase